MCASNNDLQRLAQDQSLVSHLAEQIVIPRSQRSSVLARPTYAGSGLARLWSMPRYYGEATSSFVCKLIAI